MGMAWQPFSLRSLELLFSLLLKSEFGLAFFALGFAGQQRSDAQAREAGLSNILSKIRICHLRIQLVLNVIYFAMLEADGEVASSEADTY